MCIETLVEPEPFLKFGHYIYFSQKWRGSFGGTVRKIIATQQVPRYKSYIISAGQLVNMDLRTQPAGAAAGVATGFYPESPFSIFEILFGFKSGTPPNVILYPILPSTEYFLKLEESGQTAPANPATDADLRLIGGLTEDDTDMKKPRLRVYTLKMADYMDQILLRIYNNSADVTRVVIRGTVNRCRMTNPVSEEEKNDAIAKGRYRWIPHWEDVKWS